MNILLSVLKDLELPCSYLKLAQSEASNSKALKLSEIYLERKDF